MVLLTGLIVPQCVLIGPSLIGKKLFLGVDVLTQPNVYCPPEAGKPAAAPRDVTLSMVCHFRIEGREDSALLPL
jgi:hypothetical protein